MGVGGPASRAVGVSQQRPLGRGGQRGRAHRQADAGEARKAAAVDRVDLQRLEPGDAAQGVDPADVHPLVTPLGLADEGGRVRAELPLGFLGGWDLEG